MENTRSSSKGKEYHESFLIKGRNKKITNYQNDRKIK